MTRSRLAAAGLLLAVFGLGALAGGVGVSLAEHRGGDAGTRPHSRDSYLTRLTTELTLSAAQRDSIRAIMERNKPAMDSMWGEVRPRFDSLRTLVRDEIRGQLSPEQATKYQEMIERRNREYRERRANDSQ
jgi:Spy/CpxP family protein refolding chaperone